MDSIRPQQLIHVTDWSHAAKMLWQVVEKAHQHRSRIAQRLNVREEVRFAPSLTAALLGIRRVSARQGWAGEKSGLFEQPAGFAGAVQDFLQPYVSSYKNGFQHPAEPRADRVDGLSEKSSSFLVNLRRLSTVADRRRIVALTATEIAKVMGECAPILAGGWIQKIYQPTTRTLVLEIRTPGRTHRLLISCRPETARFHITTVSFQNPPTPPPFCQFLRAHLQGARIDQVEQIQGDRIVQFALTAKEGPCRLVAELTGKTSNLLVLDEANRIRRDLNGGKNRVGQLYVLPPHQQRERGAVDQARFSQDIPESLFPLSAAIEAHYLTAEGAAVVETARNIRAGILRKIKKLRRRIEACHEDLAKAEKYKAYDRYGELIKANLGTIRKGQTDVAVVDYFDEELPNLTIPLDQAKTPQGNMDDYFRKHRKHLTAERELRPRIREGERELGTLQEELTAIEQGSWQPPEQPRQIIRTRAASRAGGWKGRQEQPQGPFRRFTSSDGLAIYVGRNARENDELTFGLAKSDDLWLHARGTPGSHVVVRLEKGSDPPPETIRDAATLALLYSDLKKSGKGDVIYTRRKWVKKAKGQAPGAVIVTQEKSLHMSLEKNRLDALKARSARE
jgi:predicted ribosome quality control (RQC) complex YloA/Tae2 family protein